jgi:hypothetical protein
LSDPGLLSGDEMIPQFSPVTEKLQSLGFKATNAEQAAGPFCAGGANATGYMEGNEAMRQRDLQGTEKDKAGPFSIRQPPDKARIAGAKVLKEMNSWLQTLAECADRCTGFTFEKTRQDNRKQVMEKLIKFCNAPESQVATLERCVKGNNLVSTERVYSSFPLGFAPIFRFLLRDSKGEVSSERLKELAGEHGHKFVKQMVTTAYRAFPGDGSLRQELKAVYEKYCRDTEQILTNLDEPLFNNDLKTLFNERDKAIAFIKEMNLSPEKKAEQIELCQKSVEQRFQTWLGNHTDKHDDGSVTINVGHMKIMVNEDQLNYVTLASLGAL